MNLQVILTEFKHELRNLYGERLADVILFGRMHAARLASISDIDVMVVLRGEVAPAARSIA